LSVSRKAKKRSSQNNPKGSAIQHTAQAESAIKPNTHRPKPAYSSEMPDGKVPYA